MNASSISDPEVKPFVARPILPELGEPRVETARVTGRRAAMGLLIGLLLTVSANASEADGSRREEAAVRTRAEWAGAIEKGETKPEQVLERLKEEDWSLALGLGPETRYAQAVLEMGKRLVVRSPAEAEVFFREGDAALGKALESLSEESEKEKVSLLRKRAWVRSRFLGRYEEAREDFAEAIRLDPDDEGLVRQRDHVLAATAEAEASAQAGN